MATAAQGDEVKVHYVGTFDDGSEFDSSTGGEPLAFTIGASQVIPGFEKAVEGMEPGDKKQIRIEAADAYGDYDADQLVTVERELLPEDLDLEVGMQLQAETEDGLPLVVTVSAIDGDKITLDGNHPMAGKALNFALELVEIGAA